MIDLDRRTMLTGLAAVSSLGTGRALADGAKKAYFERAGVEGTFVMMDGRRDDFLTVHNPERARQRFIPASTFKVAHALFALDAGIVKDEFQVFPWDGVERWRTSWNADQTLRSSMRESTVWLYQQWARELGEERERTYLQACDYGNANPGGGIDQFWLSGDLRISASEQIEFLRKLYRNQLPFDVSHQRLVKDVMITEASAAHILRSKTGATETPEGRLGWWVGWVERHEGPVFFALNLNLGETGDWDLRTRLGREILTDYGALPAA
ncbi:class D beta-lactamase [Parvularcula sp. LCG005]|uniref:class D beta-lactamase n=1 Tax=Parvularcula sp. LCG005 TaxID=3078805 RepID=UPI002943C136|nr:class D beta-lactamase [Parvularcula sp. LCG005]WOI52646.1 class D beta-lactamase [Parvularcula sp. LCG005]